MSAGVISTGSVTPRRAQNRHSLVSPLLKFLREPAASPAVAGLTPTREPSTMSERKSPSHAVLHSPERRRQFLWRAAPGRHTR